MNDPRIILQQKIFDLLTTTLTGAVSVKDGGSVSESTLPLVLIGEDEVQDDSTKDDFFTGDIVHTFHIFTSAQNAEGTKANKTIQQTIYSLFHHAPPTLSGGFACWECVGQTGEVFRDPDFPVWHGVMTFRFSL